MLFAARGLFGVLFMDAMNHRIESEFRATINSLLGFGYRLGYVVVAWSLGRLVAWSLGWVFEWFGLWVTVFSLTSLALLICLTLMLPLAYELSAQSAPDSR